MNGRSGKGKLTVSVLLTKVMYCELGITFPQQIVGQLGQKSGTSMISILVQKHLHILPNTNPLHDIHTKPTPLNKETKKQKHLFTPYQQAQHSPPSSPRPHSAAQLGALSTPSSNYPTPCAIHTGTTAGGLESSAPIPTPSPVE